MQNKKNILVVDDEPTWRKIIQHLLEIKGYAVKTAGSGSEALQLLISYKPDLIMSDVRMPDMNGFDLVDSLRKLPVMSSTPVIFLSAIDDYDARKVARNLGAVDYLLKPFDEKEFDIVLSKYL
jgi:CheY-like chemotaxis protein